MPQLPNFRPVRAPPIPYTRDGKKGKLKASLNYRVSCPNCRSPVPNLLEDYASGDVVCRDCGSVLMDRLIDMRSEWRTFSNDNNGGGDPSRVGGPSDPLLMDTGDSLDSTFISKNDGGSGLAKDLNRVQNKNVSSFKPGEKHLIKVFRDIGTMCERIGLPKLLADRAKSIYKRVDSEKLLKGRTLEGVVAACIYIACRQEKVPRTFREISSLTLVPKKDIGRCYKALAPLFLSDPEAGGNSLQHDSDGPAPNGLGTVSIADFMARFCSYLNLNMEIQKLAVVLCRKAQDLDCIAGKSPISIAAAGIYMVTQLFPQHKKPQKDIAYVAGVSEATIKNTYKDLYQRRYDLITIDMAPKSLVDSLPIS